MTLNDIPTSAFIIGLAVTAGALAWAAWSDVRSFLIPNRISVLIGGSYFLAVAFMPTAGWFAGLATGAVTLLIGAILFAQKWVGGGDVKLAAAIALWAGPSLYADFLLMTSLVAVLMGAAMLMTPLPRLLGNSGESGSIGRPGRANMPFGVPLSAGGLWVISLHLASLA